MACCRYRLRVLTVDPSALPSALTVGGTAGACEVRPVAYDGVWRSSVPHPVSASTYTVTGASRMDFAVKCSVAGDHDLLYGGELPDVNRVGFLVATAGQVTAASPYAGTRSSSSSGGSSSSSSSSSSTWEPARPKYLQDLRAAAVGASFTIRMSPSQISGKGYSASTPLATAQYDTVQEWTLAVTNEHPFHLHVYHMQVVSPGGCGAIYEEGEWYDVVSAATTAPCLVRFRTADFGGRVMLHCHELTHGDSGAMGWVNVLGGPVPDTAFLDAGTCPCIPTQNSCAVTDECGSTAGVDTCGEPCTAAAPGDCGATTGMKCNEVARVCEACVAEPGTCQLFSECGSAAGVDTCGNDCTAELAGVCGGGQQCNEVEGVCEDACAPDGSCALVAECGSAAGLDSCGGECTAAAAGACGDNEQCNEVDGVCEEAACVPDGSCALLLECGSAGGVDSCGNACTAAAAGACASGLQCNDADNVCECVPESGSCALSSPCGSTAGVDSCGNPCEAEAAGVCTGGQQCNANTNKCECTGCTCTFKCGSSAGVDSCGKLCVAAAPGKCTGGQQCTSQHLCACSGCKATKECGSTAGVDSCGNSCAVTAGTCSAKEQCSALTNACELVVNGTAVTTTPKPSGDKALRG